MPDSEINNPFDDHEILFKDKDGKIKVLRDGKVVDTQGQSLQGEKPKEDIRSMDAGGLAKATELRVPKESAEFPMGEEEGAIFDLVERLPLDLSLDENSKGRLRKIIVSRHKGVRDMIETREILLRAANIGGMGLSEEKADVIMKMVEDYCKSQTGASSRIHEDISFVPNTQDIITVKKEQATAHDATPATLGENIKASPPAEKKNEFSEARKDILKLIQEMPDYDVLPGLGKGKVSRSPVYENPPVEPAVKIKTENQPAAPEPIMEVAVESPVVANMPPEAPKAEADKLAEKKELAAEELALEKKNPVKLVGPVDELRELDVMELHKLDADPVKACEIIKKKLSMLEKYSFAELTHGIQAWRQSGVYKLYVDIGRESIMKKVPIEQVIDRLKKEGKPHLTPNEFNAIMDLNEQIRF